MKDLRAFNGRLEKCDAVFDARADNLLQFVDRIANDLGATSAILRDRSEKYNSGWFDTRADDRFWFAYGQLYGYYGVLSGAHADFRDVIVQRGLASLWTMLEDQFRADPQNPAFHHFERIRVWLADACPSRHHGILRFAGAL